MATAKQLLDIARGELGYKETPANSNRTKYGAWYGLDGQPWCVMFIEWVFSRAVVKLPIETASCTILMNAAKAAERANALAAEFWKELEKKEGIEMSPTGLAIEIIAKGDSKLPSENSNVVVKYTGKLVDGTVFDSTDKHGGAPAEFNLGRVIPGFREGLQKIGKGGKARLYIPAKLGYGNQAIPGIPPNSTLIFDVEMVDVDPAAPAPVAPPPPPPPAKK